MFSQLILYMCLAAADKDRYMCYQTLEQAGDQTYVKQYIDSYETRFRNKINSIEEPYKSRLMSYVPKDRALSTAATIVYILAIKRELTVSSPVHPLCDSLDISGSYNSIGFGLKWNLR